MSQIEDLDPEPARGGASWRNREIVLGLLIVVGALAWALGTWWHDSNAARYYRAAQQATSERHWDDALAGYSAARGYMDADARATEAAKQVNERDTQYRIAAAYRQASDGPGGAPVRDAISALSTARAVQTIEPGYKDVDVIAIEAQEQLATASLSNTVALRADASPPGLYYRTPSGWLYLPGSDSESQLYGVAGDAGIVYDMPTIGQPDNASTRHLMLVVLTDDRMNIASYQPLDLRPGKYNSFVFGKRGAWALSIFGSRPQGSGIGDSMDYRADSFIYEAYGGSPVDGKVRVAGTGARIVSLGREGGRMLVVSGGPSLKGKSTTWLFAAEPDGSNATPVFSTTGALAAAFLSPDEHYAFVVNAEKSASDERLIMTAYLLDLAAPTGTQARTQLMQTSVTGILVPGETAADIPSTLSNEFYPSAIFLRDGAFQGQLLLGWAEGTILKLRLIATGNPAASLAETTMPYKGAFYYKASVGLTAVVQSDGHTLVVHDSEYPLTMPSGEPDAPFAIIVKLFHSKGPAGPASVTDYTVSLPRSYVQSDTVPYLTSLRWSDVGLVYEVTTTLDRTFYGLPGSTPDIPPSTLPIPILAIPLSGQAVATSPIYSVVGSGALAYVDGTNSLHVRPQDGDSDVLLEREIRSIFDLNSFLSNDALR